MNSKRIRILLFLLGIALAVNSFFILRVALTVEKNDSIPSTVALPGNGQILGCTDTTLNQAYFTKTVGLNNPQSLVYTANEILRQKQVKDTLGVYREIIEKVFTPSIAEFDSTKPYSPAGINQLIIRGYNFATAANYFPNESLYLNTLADMHFNNASKQLEFYQRSNTALSNQFSFQYLTQRCLEANVGTNRKESSADKFIKTLLEEDYFHLINTTWNKSSLKLKCLIGLIGLLTILGLINTIAFISTKISIPSKS
jgi:hypothetical protein